MKVENTFRVKKSGEEKKSLFKRFENLLRANNLFEDGIPVSYLPKVLFVAFILILYIWNGHQAEKMVRKIDQMEEEVEDLRADFTTLKADYMYSRLQSEVAKRVARMGLEESEDPPYKIELKK